jgi:hypothetical protein
VQREDDRMRDPHIVRDTSERRGGAILCTGPTATALTPAKCDGGASMLPKGYHQPAGSAQLRRVYTSMGFSIVVRIVPDGVSTKRPSDCGATFTDIETILASALEKIVDRFRGAVLVTVPQATPTEIVLRAGPLELNLLERTAKRGDRQIELLPRELRLLRYMMEHSNQLLARARLMQEAWNYNSFHKQILLTFTWVDFGAE